MFTTKLEAEILVGFLLLLLGFDFLVIEELTCNKYKLFLLCL